MQRQCMVVNNGEGGTGAQTGNNRKSRRSNSTNGKTSRAKKQNGKKLSSNYQTYRAGGKKRYGVRDVEKNA